MWTLGGVALAFSCGRCRVEPPHPLASASTVPSSSHAPSHGVRLGSKPRPDIKKGQKQSTKLSGSSLGNQYKWEQIPVELRLQHMERQWWRVRPSVTWLEFQAPPCITCATWGDTGSLSLLRDNNDACWVARIGDNISKAPAARLAYIYMLEAILSYVIVILTIITIFSINVCHQNLFHVLHFFACYVTGVLDD